MNKTWKINQEIFYSFNEEFSDDLSNFINIESSNIKEDALDYFFNPKKENFYPGKSRAVAIIYAKLLEIHFEEDFYDVLDDPELLYNNDEYFKPYSEDKQNYDEIILELGGVDNIPLTGKWVDYTVNYFKEECLLEGFNDGVD